MSADRVEIANCIIAGMAEGGTCLEQMSEIVTRLELAGFVIVPREPTEEMMAAVDCAGKKAEWLSGKAWAAGYRAMIDAALSPSHSGTP